MDAATKTKREQQIVVALAVIFLVALAVNLKGRVAPSLPGPMTLPANQELPDVSHSIRGFRDRLASIQESAANPPNNEEAPAALIAYTAEGLRDPLISLLPQPTQKQAALPGSMPGNPLAQSPQTSMAQASQQALTPPRVTVQGIIFGTARPQALIDRRVYQVGDEIQGARIVSIERNGVVFKMRDQFFRLGVPSVRMAGGER